MSIVRDYIIFAVGENHYALAVDQVERITPLTQLTPIPTVHPFVDGMLLYQNQTIKVVDFRKMTGMTSQEAEAGKHSQKLLIYQAKEGFFAIKVDTIHDIVQIDESAIKRYSDTVEIGECMQTEGVVEYKKRLVVLIKALYLPQERAQ